MGSVICLHVWIESLVSSIYALGWSRENDIWAALHYLILFSTNKQRSNRADFSHLSLLCGPLAWLHLHFSLSTCHFPIVQASLAFYMGLTLLSRLLFAHSSHAISLRPVCQILRDQGDQCASKIKLVNSVKLVTTRSHIKRKIHFLCWSGYIWLDHKIGTDGWRMLNETRYDLMSCSPSSIPVGGSVVMYLSLQGPLHSFSPQGFLMRIICSFSDLKKASSPWPSRTFRTSVTA